MLLRAGGGGTKKKKKQEICVDLVELLTECPPPLPPFLPPPSPPTVGFDFNGLHRGTDAHTTTSEAPKQVCGTMANH